MSFGSKLLYFSLHLTSMISNSSSRTTLPSGVAPKINISELITRPHGSAKFCAPLTLYNFHNVLLQLVRDNSHKIILIM